MRGANLRAEALDAQASLTVRKALGGRLAARSRGPRTAPCGGATRDGTISLSYLAGAIEVADPRQRGEAIERALVSYAREKQ